MAYTRRLLVEGSNDWHVVAALFKHYEIPESISFPKPEGRGVEALLADLPTELLASGLKCLGLILDADESAQARWNAVKTKLTQSGYTGPPDIPQPGGAIIHQPPMPSVGVWIMPDNRRGGMLEHFIEALCPPGDMLWDRAKQAVEEIPADERLFTTGHTQKAITHTWLAWQETPGSPMGLAISQHYLRAESAAAKEFIDWCNRLFFPEAEG